MSTVSVIQELMGAIEIARGDAQAAKDTIADKTQRLEELDTVLEENLGKADELYSQLEELDEVILELENAVGDFESEF
jgi:chromosome segregation ATPase|tara:strand:- start:2062 stop:2295 length:234 start_codon:yes stop_codon:yes gene_type:complete